jgi:Tfp pilus assembly protein PilF
MRKFNLSLFSLLALLLLVSGCSNPSLKKLPFIQDEAPVQKKAEEPTDKPSPPTVRKAERELNLGIRNYENGNYTAAAGFFQNALGEDLLSVGDQVTAHKFLAFIYCVSGEKLACRGAFKKVLALNPKFGLSASEAGHPTWGPVFREVQAEVAARKTR